MSMMKVAMRRRWMSVGIALVLVGAALAQGLRAEEAKSTAAVAGLRPFAYLVPCERTDVIHELWALGVPLRVLREDIQLDVEVWRREKSPGDGLSANYEKRWFPPGTAVVPATGERGPADAAEIVEDWVARSIGDDRAGELPLVRLWDDAWLLTAPMPPPVRTGPRKRVTEDVAQGRSGVNFSGSPLLSVRWLDDGERYLAVKNGRLCKVHAETGRSVPFYSVDALTAALGKVIPDIKPEGARGLASRTSLDFNPQLTGALFEHQGDLYFATLDGKTAHRLTNSPEREELAEFSPDGQRVAFVRNYDLYVVELATQQETRLTEGGNEIVRNGIADWVYYEEVFNRDGRAFWWSENGDYIAFMQFDDSLVGEVPIVAPEPGRPVVERQRYPKAGDPNPRVKVGVVAAKGGPVRWIDLKDYPPESTLVTRVGWHLTTLDCVYLCVQDRSQTWLDVVLAPLDPKTPDGPLTIERVVREKTGAWIENIGQSQTRPELHLLWLTDKTGFRHIYPGWDSRVSDRALTEGEWDVKKIVAHDVLGVRIFFMATKDSPIAENLYCLGEGENGLEIKRLTPENGNHLVFLNHDRGYCFDDNCRMFVDVCSSHKAPAKVRLYRTDGRFVRMIDDNPVAALDEYELAPVELVQIKTRDGFALEGTLIKPPDFDATKEYPVWVLVYGGPQMPSVVDSWRGGRAYEQMLAAMGIVVLRCDPRSASGKGAKSAWTAYKQLGVQEARDMEDAADWLTAQGWCDGSRIGISGGSYGGYLTAYCLTHTKKFAAGIAASAVTDWRNYDTIYTERYMLTPQENAEGYEKASVVAAAKDLHGKLLLVHGGMDDNVHVQNALQLARALQQAGRDFEMMIYPEMRHGIHGRHYQKLTLDFIRRTMGVAN
ncbi:MAG: DPP IV N-terminal domain-containing protein [Planctomycetia bacterium]|nr:DPP IV N-terminal domain-containing protein [Planctomycetia bacterium]